MKDRNKSRRKMASVAITLIITIISVSPLIIWAYFGRIDMLGSIIFLIVCIIGGILTHIVKSWAKRDDDRPFIEL